MTEPAIAPADGAFEAEGVESGVGVGVGVGETDVAVDDSSLDTYPSVCPSDAASLTIHVHIDIKQSLDIIARPLHIRHSPNTRPLAT